MAGADAREVARRLLSALRRAQRRTRLRAEWAGGGPTYRSLELRAEEHTPSTVAAAGALATWLPENTEMPRAARRPLRRAARPGQCQDRARGRYNATRPRGRDTRGLGAGHL